MTKQITAVVVGAGHRALYYASYAKTHPSKLKIVGVCDPNELRRNMTAKEFGFSGKFCFKSAEELAKQPKFADVIINGTMDGDHVRTTLPLLARGYDVLLEKPISVNEEDLLLLLRAVKKYKRKVVICHVLRYAPFYQEIRKLVKNGEIGKIYNVQTTELVSYHHMGVAFVRGKWNNRKNNICSMLMSKCCHDLDLLAWMKSGVRPAAVSSFGSNVQFKKENAPAGSGKYCLVDCKIEGKCDYSARKHYLWHPKRWSFYVWAELEHLGKTTQKQKMEYLKKGSPFGRCVYRCDNNVVDHQSVLVEFEDGCTATHNMIGGVAKPSRAIHLIGTKGEIQGVLEENKFTIRHIDARPGHETSEKIVDLASISKTFDGHGGGDLRLVEDFVAVMGGKKPSISYTNIEDSINGHLIGFRADLAMETRKVVNIPEM